MVKVICDCCDTTTIRCGFCDGDDFVPCDCVECLNYPEPSSAEKCATCGEII
jgi:hypothetical protein